MIEPAAGRLFDIYYQYTAQSDLVALQSLTEEAYKLHERLSKSSPKNQGLFEIDEFLLLKALRNYSVHKDDFQGKAYSVNRKFAEQYRLELMRVCLIEKKVLRKAINEEPILGFGEQSKVEKINKQLVDFGEFYNVEPVIFNFMVKVYEKLTALKLNIPGTGFKDLETSYKNEVYHNYPHYVQLQSVNASNEQVLSNIRPLSDLNSLDKTGLVAEKDDLFAKFTTLDLDYQSLKLAEYQKNDYQAMHDSTLKKILDNPDMLKVAQATQKHIGLALNNADSTKTGDVNWFNISKQCEKFVANGIDLDSVYYETTAYELLVLYIYKDNLFPIVIYKSELIKKQTALQPRPTPGFDSIDFSEFGENFSINVPASNGPMSAPQANPFDQKLGRNDPCFCGSGKKFKKCCLQ